MCITLNGTAELFNAIHIIQVFRFNSKMVLFSSILYETTYWNILRVLLGLKQKTARSEQCSSESICFDQDRIIEHAAL